MRTIKNMLLNLAGITNLEMNSAPVNALSLEFMTEFIDKLEAEARDAACKGVVISSASKSVFCAGLQLTEMYQPEEQRLREFWRNVQVHPEKLS